MNELQMGLCLPYPKWVIIAQEHRVTKVFSNSPYLLAHVIITTIYQGHSTCTVLSAHTHTHTHTLLAEDETSGYFTSLSLRLHS